MNDIDLGGEWDIRSADGKYTMKGTVPGTVFQYLEEQGEFGQEGIFYRENNRRCVESARRDFTFSRHFSFDGDPNDERTGVRTFLEADGLDTLATITINGRTIGETRNMHRRYRFDVRDALVAGDNTIGIRFADSLSYVDREHARRRLWHAYWEDESHAYQGFNMIRKSHCSYGWDWGPIVPDAGIWRSIRIRSYEGGKIESIRISQEHSDGSVTLHIDPHTTVWHEGEYTLLMTVTDPDGGSESREIPVCSPGSWKLADPCLWWPNGLGDQPLYTLEFRLIRDGNADRVIDRSSYRIGLRTMEVRKDPDEWGESFCFAVNGVPVFARGADYIPEDVCLTRVNRERTERLVADCAKANFNCLRVWGGGVYPEDHFFDLCDEYGLIVWQDFMFACAIYDVNNPEFMAEMEAEVVDNLRRIRHHASLGLICGNNEMEWGFVEWGFPHTGENRTEYLKQYQFVFPTIATEEAPDVFYWPASPSSGGDFEEPNSPDRGDCHFWQVWHGNLPFTEYKNHYFRFMSEFGFESFPSMKTIRTFTEEEDLNIFSPVMEDHQRCVGGNGKILNYVSRYFRYPRDLDSLVYVSQVSQAEALRHGIEHWRRNRGRCMGAVYWQLNDNWPVASWSSIDYFGRWKALHYVAKRAYAPVLISCDGEDSRAVLHISNEDTTPVTGMVRWSLRDLTGRLITEGSHAVTAGPFSDVTAASLDLAEHLRGNDGRNRCLHFSFETSAGDEYHGSYLFEPFKTLSLHAPELAVEIGEDGDDWTVTVSATATALFVEIDLTDADAVFSDNFFDLAGGESRTVSVPNDSVAKRVLQSQLTLRSLRDTYVPTTTG